MDRTFALHGKTVVITGGSRNMGRHMALAMADAGADLAILDLPSQTEDGLTVVDQIRSKNRQGLFLPLDLRAVELFQPTMASVLDEFGSIDILVNNAFRLYSTPFLDQTVSDFDDLTAIGLRGTYFLSQVVAKTMIERQIGGSIIHIASRLALQVRLDWSVYATIKAGVVHMGRAMALELERFGIRVNSVAPGAILPAQGNAELPLGRGLQYEDIPSVVVFLASDAASMITGQVIVVDGGLSLQGPLS